MFLPVKVYIWGLNPPVSCEYLDYIELKPDVQIPTVQWLNLEGGGGIYGLTFPLDHDENVSDNTEKGQRGGGKISTQVTCLNIKI